jgi:hypothetical protein
MRTLFTLAALGLASPALAAPTLTVDGACDGWATATVTDSTNYRLVFGEAGDDTVPGGGCAETPLGVVGSASAPMSDAETSFVLTGAYCGQSAQVIDMDTCAVSDVVTLPDVSAYDDGWDDGYDAGLEDAVCDITSDNATLCSAEQYWDGTSCLTLDLVVDVSPADGHDDESYTAGAGSVDITSNDATICGDAGGTWDGETCTAAAAEESMNCFQSGYCQAADDLWGTGVPNSIVGNATEAECYSSTYAGDRSGWVLGSYLASLVELFPYPTLCE